MNRAISAAFPEIKEIGGVRSDSLHWHPDGLALDIMIPNWDTPKGASSAMRSSTSWSVIAPSWGWTT